MEAGLTLMGIGMGTVLVFLVLLIGAMNGVRWVALRFGPPESDEVHSGLEVRKKRAAAAAVAWLASREG